MYISHPAHDFAQMTPPAFIPHLYNACRCTQGRTTLPLRIYRVAYTCRALVRQGNRSRRRRWLSREKNDATRGGCRGFSRALRNHVSTNITTVSFPANKYVLFSRGRKKKTEKETGRKRKSIEVRNEGVNLVRIVTAKKFNGLQI